MTNRKQNFAYISYAQPEVWLVGRLILNVPVNNFLVMLGRSHRFLGITSTLRE